jgi:heme/copper-type cytochrome/quinol oxidase subunit 2
MTPRQAGQLLGMLTGAAVVCGFVWLVIVLTVLFVAKILGRRYTLSDAARNIWILWTVAALFVLQILQMMSVFGGR